MTPPPISVAKEALMGASQEPSWVRASQHNGGKPVWPHHRDTHKRQKEAKVSSEKPSIVSVIFKRK